jgi:hypothetical protein
MSDPATLKTRFLEAPQTRQEGLVQA